jgi:hypothetical protein
LLNTTPSKKLEHLMPEDDRRIESSAAAMRNNNIERNSLPNNSSQTDNTLFLLKPLLD